MTRGTLSTPAVVLLIGVLALAACASPRDGSRGSGGADPGTRDGPDQLYQVAATVLESPDHGPQLCMNVADSYPPQCGGPDIVGWDWDAVEAESASGTTWGSYLVVGSWDGERFTVTEPPRPDDGSLTPDRDQDYDSPCQEPDGGWQPPDPASATDEAMREAIGRARTASDFAGSWIDQSYLDQLGDLDDRELERQANDPARLVLNLRFTGDLDERERWIREVWGGALCVSAAEHSEAELLDIQQRLHDEMPDIQNSGIDTLANAVTAQVFLATDELQRELDDRYGEGTVILHGWLQRLP